MILFIVLNGIYLSTQMPSKYAQVERIYSFLVNSDAANGIFRMVEQCLVQCISETILESEGSDGENEVQVESETVYPNKIFEGCIRIQLTSNGATKRSMYPGGVKRKGRLRSNSKQQAFGRDLVDMVDPESIDAGKDGTSK